MPRHNAPQPFDKTSLFKINTVHEVPPQIMFDIVCRIDIIWIYTISVIHVVITFIRLRVLVFGVSSYDSGKPELLEM